MDEALSAISRTGLPSENISFLYCEVVTNSNLKSCSWNIKIAPSANLPLPHQNAKRFCFYLCLMKQFRTSQLSWTLLVSSFNYSSRLFAFPIVPSLWIFKSPQQHSRFFSSAMAEDTAACAVAWSPDDPQHTVEAREALNVWPLDAYNAALLNEVHPRHYSFPTPHVRSLSW